MTTLENRIQQVEDRIKKAAQAGGRKREDVLLLAVTKTWGADVVRKAYDAGLRNFGENYVQEALEKIENLKNEIPEAKWHFIGHLQSNKVKNLIGKFEMIHSVDRISLAEEISKRVDQNPDVNEPQKILIEVNIANEESKNGISFEALPEFLDEIQAFQHIMVRGLMIMPPISESKTEVKRLFNQIRDEKDRLSTRLSSPHSLIELSMGTSHDYVEAIEAGATIVRLGTTLFGERE
ncbi:MAG: YggS family pyridoxal phosphate-dependent enzyme [Bdellovibrionota bacterium]